jgi:hypothetical protein
MGSLNLSLFLSPYFSVDYGLLHRVLKITLRLAVGLLQE